MVRNKFMVILWKIIVEVFVEISNYSTHYHKNSTIRVTGGLSIEIEIGFVDPDLSGHVEERQRK